MRYREIQQTDAVGLALQEPGEETVPNSPSEASWLQRAQPGSSNSSGSSKGSNVVNILGLKFLIPPGLMACAGWGSTGCSLGKKRSEDVQEGWELNRAG
jgi:hypothetical protein